MDAFISYSSQEFALRFDALLKSSRANAQAGAAALVPAAGERSRLACEGLVGGKDVQLVLVRAKNGPGGKPLPILETLTYRKDVAGSDLVYDLTGEFLQGKARPFDCDLRQFPVRLYALLPFQVESLTVVARQHEEAIRIEIEYQNALGKVIEGALPCHAELRSPDDKIAWEHYLATSEKGTLTAMVDLPKHVAAGKWSLAVRSLLDGKQVKLPVEVGPWPGPIASKPAAGELPKRGIPAAPKAC